jgi:hypothetical protein
MADPLNPHQPAVTERPFRPLLITARYACDCVGRDVLVESIVLDLDGPDEVFIWAMQGLLRSVRAEIAQHLNPPKTVTAGILERIADP